MIRTFTAGILSDAEVDTFLPIMAAKRQAATQEKKEAFKAKMGAVMDLVDDSKPAAENMKALIKGIRDVLMAAAADKGDKQEASEATKTQMKTNMTAWFSVPAQCPVHDEFAGNMKTTLRSIVGP